MKMFFPSPSERHSRAGWQGGDVGRVLFPSRTVFVREWALKRNNGFELRSFPLQYPSFQPDFDENAPPE